MQVNRPPSRERTVLDQFSDMDLRLLQVFKNVAECCGISAPSSPRAVSLWMHLCGHRAPLACAFAGGAGFPAMPAAGAPKKRLPNALDG
jgi:hypothetical protein